MKGVTLDASFRFRYASVTKLIQHELPSLRGELSVDGED